MNSYRIYSRFQDTGNYIGASDHTLEPKHIEGELVTDPELKTVTIVTMISVAVIVALWITAIAFVINKVIGG